MIRKERRDGGDARGNEERMKREDRESEKRERDKRELICQFEVEEEEEYHHKLGNGPV